MRHIAVVIAVALLGSCDDSPKPDKGVLNGRSDGLVKYRDEANRVTCYVRDWSNSSDGALACVRDPEPMPSCSGVPR